MGNPFFDLVKYRPKRSKKKLNCNYIVLYGKNAFRFNFGPREEPQPENAWKWKCVFSGWGNWKHFSHKVLDNYNSKFFVERLGLYFTKSKNGFPIVFSNLARKGSRGFFQARKLIFLPNGLYLPTKQPWGSPKFGFCHHQLELSPSVTSICGGLWNAEDDRFLDFWRTHNKNATFWTSLVFQMSVLDRFENNNFCQFWRFGHT